MKRKIEKSVLANGLTVFSEYIDSVESVTLGVWCNVGARDERLETCGAAHFLEHMAFKGTKRRTARALSEEIEAVGGFMNAYTGKERTAYHIRVMKEHVPLAVDILADILQFPTFESVEFERERGVILQEIGQSEDTPDDIIFDRYQQASYPNHAMGRPILGRPHDINSFSVDTVSGFMQDNYHAHSMALCAAGKIKHDQLCTLAEQHFTALNSKQSSKKVKRTKPDYQGGDYRELRPNEQVHLLLGFQGLGYLDKNYITMTLLSSLLGGGMSSRLFQRIREQMGLVYDISTIEMPASDCGLFAIYAGTSEQESGNLITALKEELDKVQDNISPQELDRAKAQLRSALLMSRESTTARAEQIAHHHHIYGEIIPDPILLERIEAVNEVQIAEVAASLFNQTPVLASIGPITHVPQVEAIF